MNEMQECGREDPLPLTNGHTHLVNGALKPGDLSPGTDEPSADQELPERRVSKPQSPAALLQTKPDPYEFPHSPPKQSEAGLDRSSSPRPKAPPPSHQEPGANQRLQRTPLSPPSHSLSHSPIRLNGSHHNAFPSDSINTTKDASRPEPPTEMSFSSSSSSSSKASEQLLAQTGGLISEYYSHSRLHQISTWRTGFSEYVNELHSKRKAAGGASFAGKERLRKQHPADGRGKGSLPGLFVENGCLFPLLSGDSLSLSVCDQVCRRPQVLNLASSTWTWTVSLCPSGSAIDPSSEVSLSQTSSVCNAP